MSRRGLDRPRAAPRLLGPPPKPRVAEPVLRLHSRLPHPPKLLWSWGARTQRISPQKIHTISRKGNLPKIRIFSSFSFFSFKPQTLMESRKQDQTSARKLCVAAFLNAKKQILSYGFFVFFKVQEDQPPSQAGLPGSRGPLGPGAAATSAPHKAGPRLLAGRIVSLYVN